MKTESEKVGERESESVSIVLHVNVSLDMNKVTKREVDLVQDLCERLLNAQRPEHVSLTKFVDPSQFSDSVGKL